MKKDKIILLALTGIVSAQAHAQITTEKITLEQMYVENYSPIPENSLSKVWGNAINSKDNLFSVFGNRYIQDGVSFYYVDPNKDLTLEKRNPALKSIYQRDVDHLTLLGYKESIVNLEADKSKGIYELLLSSDSNVIKNLIMRVAYELHLGYQEAKAALSDPEGNLDLKKIKILNGMIEKTNVNHPAGILLRDQLEKDVKRSGIGRIDAINQMMEKYGDVYSEIQSAVAAGRVDDKHFVFQLPNRTVDGTSKLTTTSGFSYAFRNGIDSVPEDFKKL